MAWKRAKLPSEPVMTTDMARISAVSATNICRVDERKKDEAVKKRKMSSASYLRHPGKDTVAEETDDDKARTVYKQLCEEELASGKLSDTERASIELELEEVNAVALNFGKRALLYSNGNHCE